MIQFPSGPGFDPAQAAQGVDRNSLPAARPVAAGSAVPQADTLEWHDPVSAALDLDLLRDWDDGPARATGAAEYQQAVDAVSRGDRGAALHHLEQSVLTHPAYADAAQQDPAFDAVRTEVREMVSRVGLAARMRAETAIGDARSAIESSHVAHATGAAQLAWINLAQAQFDSASHAGYIAAAQAAARASATCWAA